MRHTGIMGGNPLYQHEKCGPQRLLLNPFVKVTAPAAGIFTALHDQGAQLQAGQLIGRIADLEGTTLGEVLSPIAGVVHEMYPARVVVAGDSVFWAEGVDVVCCYGGEFTNGLDVLVIPTPRLIRTFTHSHTAHTIYNRCTKLPSAFIISTHASTT
jgi:hypothetical protein